MIVLFLYSLGSPEVSSMRTQGSNMPLSKVGPLLYSESIELLSNPGSTNVRRKLIHPMQTNRDFQNGLPLDFNNDALEEMDNLNKIDRDGLSAIHRAVRGNKIQTVRILLDYGADINLKDKDGFTALHAGVRYVRKKCTSKGLRKTSNGSSH